MKNITIKFCFFNDVYNLYIDIESKLEFVSQRNKNDSKGMFRLTSYVDESGNIFYTYGYNDYKNKPGHGGEWSSRPAIINGVFDTDIVGCGVKQPNKGYLSMAINRNDIVLPKGFSWKQTNPTDDTYGIISSFANPERNTWVDYLGRKINSSKNP